MPLLCTTAYFPPGYYMAEVLRADEIIIEAYETYSKQTCRNHCTIMGPNGRQTLSIPVTRVNGNHTMTRDIRISGHEPWQKTHWRTIQTAYNNSPFFLFYQDQIVRFFEKSYTFLLDLNLEILQTLQDFLTIKQTVRPTEKFETLPIGVRDLRAMTGAKYPPVNIVYPPYIQVFDPHHGFLPALSILDIIFNLGPEAAYYLEKIK